MKRLRGGKEEGKKSMELIGHMRVVVKIFDEPGKLNWNHENHERHEHSDGYVNPSAHLAGESIITRSLSVNA